MPAAAILLAEETVEQWRTSADADHPAGPLFAAGTFAETDIMAAERLQTGLGASICTGSHTIDCC